MESILEKNKYFWCTNGNLKTHYAAAAPEIMLNQLDAQFFDLSGIASNTEEQSITN